MRMIRVKDIILRVEEIYTKLDTFMKSLQEKGFLNRKKKHEESQYKRVGVKSLFENIQ